MHFERLTNENHPLFNKALTLYDLSFPYFERRELKSQIQTLKDCDYRFDLIYDNDAFVGLILFWETEKFIYIEHFCIFPELRNKKYGQKVLNAICQTKKTVILEIDPPVDEISIRRKNFYIRCGFFENPFYHEQLPFHKNDTTHHLIIMTFPRVISQAEYDFFKTYYKNRIMNNVF